MVAPMNYAIRGSCSGVGKDMTSTNLGIFKNIKFQEEI
jgi:hypothetical protein